MLAIGRGYIGIDLLRELFGLPDDAYIMKVEVERGGLVFHMVSKNEVEGKLARVNNIEDVRIFRLKEEDLENYHSNHSKKGANSAKVQGENHDS